MANCVANWSLILEYLKVLLAWPTVALVIACVVLYLFKEPLRTLIAKFREGSFGNVKVRFEDQSPTSTPPASVSFAELADWFRNEKRLNIVFGTQVDLLRALESQGVPLKVSAIKFFFDEHKKRLGSADTSAFTMETWLKWPLQEGMLIKHGEGDDATIELGPVGTQFLAYLKKYYPNGFTPRSW